MIKVLTVTGSSLKQRMWGMGLSYLTVTTTRTTLNVFVSFNKEGKKQCYLILLAPKTSLACNKLFWQQRERGLVIRKNPVGIYSQNYTVEYLKQRNMINFTIYI